MEFLGIVGVVVLVQVEIRQICRVHFFKLVALLPLELLESLLLPLLRLELRAFEFGARARKNLTDRISTSARARARETCNE